ncbi:MAG: hypothetical protein NDI60_08390 [Elusimicrobiales bacterium]|nr:hypothetical protein [Elusimicrobiales bacterium]
MDKRERFERIIARGDAFRADFLDGYRYRWYRYSPLNAGYAAWKKDCLALLREVFGPNSRRYSELLALDAGLSSGAPASVFASFLETMKGAVAELRSAPVSAGCAFDPVEDILARAEAMAARGHYTSAAVMAGAVLDGLLRRLCAARGVFCPENAATDNVNDRLLEARVYGRPRHREAVLRIALRRSAELCYTDKLNENNVREMSDWTRGFYRDYFQFRAAAARLPASGVPA